MPEAPAGEPDTRDLTRSLTEVRSEDPETISRLMEEVYDPLRHLARKHFQRQPQGHTLQPTALVHEVFLRMAGKTDVPWRSRAHFFAVCATAMRGILVDHALGRDSQKRGGHARHVTLSGAAMPAPESEIDILALHEALTELAELSERQSHVVEYRFFSGMSIPEIAHVLGVSKRTVDSDWAMARAWMSVRLSEVS